MPVPRCALHPHQELEKKKHGWFCDECGAIVANLALDAAKAGAHSAPGGLNCFVQHPVTAWLAEAQPVLRLWRMCDAYEVILRHSVALVLGDLERRTRGVLPSALASRLKSELERPSFGRWASLLEEVLVASRESPAAIPPAPVVDRIDRLYAE